MIRKVHMQADGKLAAIRDQLLFTHVNPENADKVRKKFLRRPFEPEFEYTDIPDLTSTAEKLNEVKCGRGRIGNLLRSEKQKLNERISLTTALGTSAFSKKSKDMYGKPSKKLLREAQDLMSVPGSPKDEKISSFEVRRRLKKTFDLLGFSYSVRRSTNIVTSAIVNHTQKRLDLKSKERFGNLYSYRLAVHEIATHALRAENGKLQKLSLFSRGTPEYLTTEEGLAVYNEERAGVMSSTILRNYAGRVIAIDLAQKHSFKETYSVLQEYFSREAAFKLALRAKRGLRHGSDKGAFTKDLVYLKGYLQLKEYAVAGGDFSMLWAAKIGLDEVNKSWVKELKPAKYDPQGVIEWVRQELVKNK